MPMGHPSLASVLFRNLPPPGAGTAPLASRRGPSRASHRPAQGLPAGTLTRELRLLATVGLLTCKHQGNQRIYNANRHTAIFHELSEDALAALRLHPT